MAERINISIPEDLHERLSHFKENLNMSKICQEAIGRAVRIEELKTEAPNIESLAERLKEEELKYGQKYIDEGFECGIKDAYGLSLDHFLEIDFKEENNYDWHDHSGPFIPSKETARKLKAFDERTNALSEERGMVIDSKCGIGWLLEPKNYFVRGWLNGVIHIWNQVKHQLIGLQENPLCLVNIVCEDDEDENSNKGGL